METESFAERNRRRRSENAFENLYAYARRAEIPDAKRTAERAARRIHGALDTQPPQQKQTRSSEPEEASVPHRLENRTKEQLYARAQELAIEGRSQMSKDELIEAIRSQ
jgi:hypothetical protein